MLMKNNNIILNEYKCLYIEPINDKYEAEGHRAVSKAIFEELLTFVLQNESQGTQFLVPTHKNELGSVLQAKSYVGVIEIKNKVVIEILPKIAIQEKNSRAGTQRSQDCETRKVFIKMLRCLKKSPFKHFNSAHLNTDKMPLLEIFIQMFLKEVEELVRKGLKSDYILKEENTEFLKGKLKIKEHLRMNYIHKERFFVEYDEYLQDRVENQLIKTTLAFLYKKAKSNDNVKRIREFLFVFNDISFSRNHKIDFSKVKLNRQMNDYKLVLQWCKLFLDEESFIAFKGKSAVFALLFNMNQIFEDYVATCLRKNYGDVKTQCSSKYLLEEPKMFQLKPDLIIDDNIIGDTKWKLINSDNRGEKYDISQSDIYQMFAYGKKYDKKEIWLIYPKSEKFQESIGTTFKFEDNLFLKVLCFDCKTGKFNPIIKRNSSCIIRKKRS